MIDRRNAQYVRGLRYGGRPFGWHFLEPSGGDDTGRLHDAWNAIIARGGQGTIVLGDGDFTFYDPLPTLTVNNFRVHGATPSVALHYRGGAFVNVIELDANANEGIVLRGFRLDGGEFLQGASRYLIYAPRLHRNCQLSELYLRESVGLLKVDAGYYARIVRNRFGPTVPNATLAGITLAEWQEVFGVDCAPVMLAEMNGCEINNNRFWRVGSELNGATRAHAMLVLSGTGGEFQVNTIEDVRAYTTGAPATTYTMEAEYGIDLLNFVGTVDALYVEGWDVNTHPFRVRGMSSVEFRGAILYDMEFGGTLFHNASRQDVVVRSSRGYRVRGHRLFNTQAESAGGDVVFENTTIVAGERVTDVTLSPNANNVYDTRGTAYPLGMVDGTVQRFHTMRRQFPRIVNGYAVTAGSDANGAYIQVTGGVMLLQSGQYVTFKHETDDPAALVVTRLAPSTASKFYRVFVNRAGAPYLVEYAGAQTDPTGDWLAEFATDAAGAVTGLAANYRLGVRGEYMLGTEYAVAFLTAQPAAGYWKRGDRWRNTQPAAGGTVEEVATADGVGAAASWKACQTAAP